jgi:formylmethanofuran dehydrogenase subunit C
MKTMLILRPRYSFKAPIYADCISPDVFAGKSLKEISALKVWEGNKQCVLKDLFTVKGKVESIPEETTVDIRGNLRKVRTIGAKMTTGKIIIAGDVGMHLGEMMKGGEIIVRGNVDSWAGCMMEDGRIEVIGSAGDYVGAPYRGSTNGMKDGVIIIHGDAGSEVGCYMRGGFINIHGDVNDFPGIHMRDGTMLVQGDCEGRAGAGMLNGKIIICGHLPSVLPTFTIDSIRPTVKAEGEKVTGPFYRFIGDIAENGKGKLFVEKTGNPHLSFYEKYL